MKSKEVSLLGDLTDISAETRIVVCAGRILDCHARQNCNWYGRRLGKQRTTSDLVPSLRIETSRCVLHRQSCLAVSK